MISLAALAPVAVKFRAVLSALGVGGTAAIVLAFAIFGPSVSVPVFGLVWEGGYAPRLSAARKATAAAIVDRDAARASADAQAAAVTECEARRNREAGVCAASLARVDADLRARLERCETRQDRLNAALAPRDGDPDAPPVCLPRRLVPLERVLEH